MLSSKARLYKRYKTVSRSFSRLSLPEAMLARNKPLKGARQPGEATKDNLFQQFLKIVSQTDRSKTLQRVVALLVHLADDSYFNDFPLGGEIG